MKAYRQVETEAEFQTAVVQVARTLGWRVHHQRISIGSGAGWPDLTLYRPGALLFRELKTDTGKLTVAQNLTLRDLEAAGCDVAVWRPADWPLIVKTLQRREAA